MTEFETPKKWFASINKNHNYRDSLVNRYIVLLCISWSEYNLHAHVPVPEYSIEILRQDRMGGGGGGCGGCLN